jgi:hypothetical protein
LIADVGHLELCLDGLPSVTVPKSTFSLSTCKAGPPVTSRAGGGVALLDAAWITAKAMSATPAAMSAHNQIGAFGFCCVTTFLDGLGKVSSFQFGRSLP